MTTTSAQRPSDSGIASESEVVRSSVGQNQLSSNTGERLNQPQSVLVGASLCILAALLVGFLVNLTVVGSLKHARDQVVAFDSLRVSLAKATAPVGPKDVNGRLLSLGTPVALITIPKLGVEQTVLEGTTSRVLVSGPGHQRSSVLPGQAGSVIIMGRKDAYGGPFAGLKNMYRGQLIQTTTGQGKATYKVVAVNSGAKAAVAPANLPLNRLTLITADGYRFLPDGITRVDAELITPAFNPAAQLLSDASLTPAEAALAGDSSAWIPLVFWIQALLVAALAMTWAWARWGRWQAWVVGVPVILFIGLSVAGQVSLLLPNLI